MEDKKNLDRLHDVVIEEFLAMSPEEVMEFTTQEDLDSVKSNLEDAIAQVGRARLARAKAAAATDARRPRPVGSTGGGDALRAARANDADFDKKLTLAARKGGASYEADRVGIEEDLDELRRWHEDEDSV
ncbi:hypothetical protein [Sphingopyxis sp. KK2]|uniref:hypothetical protein n=1 Tax=Sphingopyxis sp. KK2 TaxID=1855727 RepID=UPI00097E5E65|nr:hypothetical protein [Sphingopyxis sp. KK2]